MSDERQSDKSNSPGIASAVAGRFANRRDLLRTATGVVAASVVGSALLEGTTTAAAAAPTTGISVSFSDGQTNFQALGYHFEIDAQGQGGAPFSRVLNPSGYQPVVVTKQMDASTPMLFETLIKGGLDWIQIKFDLQDQKAKMPTLKLYKIELAKIEQFSNFDPTADVKAPGAQVYESLSLNFSKIEWTYTSGTPS